MVIGHCCLAYPSRISGYGVKEWIIIYQFWYLMSDRSFTNDSNWQRFEEIQADIFDHLLVASKEFDLQIMQIGFPK